MVLVADCIQNISICEPDYWLNFMQKKKQKTFSQNIYNILKAWSSLVSLIIFKLSWNFIGIDAVLYLLVCYQVNHRNEDEKHNVYLPPKTYLHNHLKKGSPTKLPDHKFESSAWI